MPELTKEGTALKSTAGCVAPRLWLAAVHDVRCHLPTPRRLAAEQANRCGRSRHPKGQGSDRSRSSHE